MHQDGTHLLAEQGGKQWSSGTCACCSDADSCCLSCWCPCVQYGLNQERAFTSQRRTCCRWAMLWMTPMIVAWLLLELAQELVGEQQCRIVCFDEHHRAHEIAAPPDLNDMQVNGTCHQHCSHVFPVWMEVLEPFVWIVAGLVVAVMAGRRRALLRSQHRIRGTLESDIACHCLCGCCSLAQEARQIAHEELHARAEQPNGVPTAHTAIAMPPTLPAAALAQPSYMPDQQQQPPQYPYADTQDALPALAQPIAQPVYSSYDAGKP
jgi:Cys-rich protein (TIGR01571 family)